MSLTLCKSIDNLSLWATSALGSPTRFPLEELAFAADDFFVYFSI
jgi:hypothetical protein